jgi:hypothetical protein
MSFRPPIRFISQRRPPPPHASPADDTIRAAASRHLSPAKPPKAVSRSSMVLSASASVKPVARVVHTKRLAGINVPLSTLSSSSSSTAKATCGPAQLRRWCGEVKVRDFGGECWRLVIPSAAYRLLLRTPSPARPAGAQLLAKDRKHAENRLPPPPASRCASSSSRERASRRVRAHTSSTDPPRPSGTPPTTSSAGVAAATATCCRSRASSSPCRRSAAAAGRSAKSCSGSGVAR